MCGHFQRHFRCGNTVFFFIITIAEAFRVLSYLYPARRTFIFLFLKTTHMKIPPKPLPLGLRWNCLGSCPPACPQPVVEGKEAEFREQMFAEAKQLASFPRGLCTRRPWTPTWLCPRPHPGRGPSSPSAKGPGAPDPLRRDAPAGHRLHLRGAGGPAPRGEIHPPVRHERPTARPQGTSPADVPFCPMALDGPVPPPHPPFVLSAPNVLP